jgi:hypothetical protein
MQTGICHFNARQFDILHDEVSNVELMSSDIPPEHH